MSLIRNIILLMVSSLYLVLFFMLIDKESYGLGILSLIMFSFVVYFAFRNNNKKKPPIPKSEVIKKYIDVMENDYGISVLPNQTLKFDEATPEDYVMVLYDIDEDTGMVRYFPFECNKYEFIFGRGTGSIKYRVTEAYNWLLKNNRLNLRPEVYHAYKQKVNERNEDNSNIIED